MKGLIHVFLIALLFHSTLQIGTLWVNEIWGNQDTHRVRIEDLVFDDTTMLADFIDGLTNRGVFIEDTQAVDNDMNIPGFLHVFGSATLHGASFFNGGIYADDGDETTTDVWSFIVEDNTGVTTIKGQLRPFGGINADNCLFTVHNITGDTRITSALLRPNGGIEVRNELFTVSDDDGSFRTRADGIVSLDFIQGNGAADAKLVTRVPAATDFGGNFFIKGQDGVSGGGNLVIVPGESNVNGNILFGRKFADDLYVGRSGLDTLGTIGGETIIGGQDAYDGAGGDFYLVAGAARNPTTPTDTSSANRVGGDILLDVGLSTHNGLPGRIILGTDVAGESGFDLIIRRPPSPANSNGGDTSFIGQDSSSPSGYAGGDLYLQAGDLTGGAGSPGDLAVVPGRSSTEQGDIFIGSQTTNRALGDLHVRRLDVYQSAGDTFFQGQDTNEGAGATPGDLYLVAGEGQGAASTGGDIWIMPGTSEKGTPGNIIWGNSAHSLIVTRNPAIALGGGAIGTTTLQGQTSTFGSGGDYNFAAGDGNDAGGTLLLTGATGVPSNGVANNGGDASFSAGTGNANGGSVFINGGFGQEGDGGAVIFSAGNTQATGLSGASITLSTGTAQTGRGDIIIGPNAGSFYVDNARVQVIAPFVTMRSGSNTLLIRGDSSTSTLQFNGRTILRATIPAGVVPNPTTGAPTAAVDQQTSYAILNNLTATVRGIVCALGDPDSTHNSHGLFNIVTTADISTNCDAAGF